MVSVVPVSDVSVVVCAVSVKTLVVFSSSVTMTRAVFFFTERTPSVLSEVRLTPARIKCTIPVSVVPSTSTSIRPLEEVPDRRYVPLLEIVILFFLLILYRMLPEVSVTS